MLSLIERVDVFVDTNKTALCQFASKYRGIQNVEKIRRKLFLLSTTVNV
jgi:hypothetical protein